MTRVRNGLFYGLMVVAFLLFLTGGDHEQIIGGQCIIVALLMEDR